MRGRDTWRLWVDFIDFTIDANNWGRKLSNTMKSVSSDLQTLRSGLRKQGAVFFNQLWSVWISDETLFSEH